jgi:AraC-like DNA-binding protein
MLLGQTLFHRFDVRQHPGLIEERWKRSIEAEQDFEFSLGIGGCPVRLFARRGRRAEVQVHRFFSSAEYRPQLLDSPVALDCFQNELLTATKDLFTRCQHSHSRNFVRWHCQKKSTLELAMSHPDQSLSISDLARQNDVPERTLRTAFQRCYGLSPMEYLRIHRLHQARRLLRASCYDETTVTQIGFGLGFWDLGRFAGAYRQLFGERPSETLRKCVRVSIGSRQP